MVNKTTQAGVKPAKAAAKPATAKKFKSLRDALAAEQPRREELTLECWPEPVVMQAPSLSDRMLIGRAYQDHKDDQKAAANLANAIGICAALHDQNGERVFDPADENDTATVAGLAPHILEPLVAALYRVNGYVKASAAEKN